jgi:hypothetical protein
VNFIHLLSNLDGLVLRASIEVHCCLLAETRPLTGGRQCGLERVMRALAKFMGGAMSIESEHSFGSIY